MTGEQEIPWDGALSLSSEVLVREVDGEAVLLELEGGTYFGLDGTGTRMWTLLSRHRRLDAVHRALCEEYDAPPEVLERDLLEFVRRLVEQRLLRFDAP